MRSATFPSPGEAKVPLLPGEGAAGLCSVDVFVPKGRMGLEGNLGVTDDEDGGVPCSRAELSMPLN